MKLKKVQGALQEHPWLLGQLTPLSGVSHTVDTEKRKQIIVGWAVRNVRDVLTTPFTPLILDDGNSHRLQHIGDLVHGPQALGLYRVSAFMLTRYKILLRPPQKGHLVCAEVDESFDRGHEKVIDGKVVQERHSDSSLRKRLKECIIGGCSVIAIIRFVTFGISSANSSVQIDVYPYPSETKLD